MAIPNDAREEAFLSAHLGGRLEQMAGDKIPGSAAVVREVGASSG